MTALKSTLPSLDFEIESGYPARIIAGVDEVGRGCLAGPVVAAAVIVPAVVDRQADRWLLEVTDSKQVSAETREMLVPKIQSWARSTAIGVASVEEIDRLNILNASHLAMLRAVRALHLKPDFILVDGNRVPQEIAMMSRPIIKGDLHSLSIACASIIAKVWRDHLMVELDTQFPGYGLAAHKGYPTEFHLEALTRTGVSPLHRRSFSPVAQQASLFTE